MDFLGWHKRLGTIMTGDFTGDFADFLEESQAVLRVLAASEEVWMKEDPTNPLANPVTMRDDALMNTAQELFDSATLYREGRLR